MKRSSNRIATLPWLLMALVVPTSTLLGQEKKSPSPPAEFDVAVHLESFDYVWSKIKESHWDPKQVGEKWTKARNELRPKVENAKSIKEVRQAMRELLKRLGQSHFGILPASVYDATRLKREGEGESGLTFRLGKGDRVLVTAVRSGTDAEKKGIEPGWEIVDANGKLVKDLLAQFRKAAPKIIRPETMIALRFGNTLTGPVGETVDCKFVDPNGQSHQKKLILSLPPGIKVAFGNLPSMRIDMESKLLPSNVGYFRFNGFFDPIRLMPAYRKAVREFEDADGLIIDIRGNGGGIVGMTMGFAGPLAPTKAPLGVMEFKDSTLRLAVNKSRNPYSKKIAVLVDAGSASSSEIFSGGLQDLSIARIFGRRTAGLSLPSSVEKLPNGDGFQYAFANYVSAGGEVLEGRGVIPDVTIELTPENLNRQWDPDLKKAIQWIQEPQK